MVVVQMLFFFVSACVTRSLEEKVLCYALTKTKDTGNEATQNLVKIYKYGLLPPHYQRSMYREMKEEITSQKINYSKSEKRVFKNNK